MLMHTGPNQTFEHQNVRHHTINIDIIFLKELEAVCPDYGQVKCSTLRNGQNVDLFHCDIPDDDKMKNTIDFQNGSGLSTLSRSQICHTD